ncbi:unnamed protein product [Mycena citricolor]|uniref:NAD(P)-binding protein n=1 Tax=Mycena citricolor TaxID=2018698 RepID=A0AAD2K342_9AGAR|nr:unnamed protein product [Mycena citricolor]
MSIYSQFFVPRAKFHVNDIPDLTGKVMLVTGGYSGIGYETTKALLAHGAKVYIAGRSRKGAEDAMRQFRAELPDAQVAFIQLDLADLPTIRSGAEEFLRLETRLDVLFNNGGVMDPPVDQLTSQGYDLQFGTNVLGHFYLTQLLLPTLLSTAQLSSDGKTRVIHTASLGNVFAPSLDFSTFRDDPKRQKMGSTKLYNQSKLGNVIFSAELARRYGDQGLVSVALNPGNLKTGIARHWKSFGQRVMKLFGHLIVYPAHMGALTQLYAGTTAPGAELNGKYLVPWARAGKPNPLADDETLGKDLWTWLEEQI